MSTTTCTLPSCAKKTAYNTKSLSHCGNNPHIKYQQDTTGLYIGKHSSSLHINICIHSDSRTYRSFKMQRDGILQQENRHVSTYTLTRSHTAMMKKHRNSTERRSCPTISPTGPPSNPLLLPLLSPCCKWEGHPQLKAVVEEEKKEQEG